VRKYIWLLVLIIWGALLSFPWAGLPPLSKFLIYPSSALRINYEAKNLQIEDSAVGTFSLTYNERGVPHIFADNYKDMAFAMGYSHAKDRLFQVEMLSRTVKGRLSQVAGAKALPSDKWWLKFQFEVKAKGIFQEMQKTDPELAQILTNYSLGFNKYIANLELGQKPVEYHLLGFEPSAMQPYTPVMLIAYMSKVLAYSENDLKFTALKNVLPDSLINLYYPFTASRAFSVYPELDSIAPSGNETVINSNNFRLNRNFEGADVRRSGDQELGSNNWAVAAKKSETGHAFLCNDTHLKLALPSTWYEAHQVIEGKIVHGFSIPGAPFVISGFNQKVAWGMTNATWDLTEFYALETNDQNEYRLDGEWTNINAHTINIPVKGQDSVSYTFYNTYFGPADTLDNTLLATHWVGSYLKRNEVKALYELSTSQNITEAHQALQNFGSPPQNFVLADVNGAVGMVTAGYAMVHPKPSRGISLGTKKSDLVPFIHMGERLKVLQPGKGFVQSANHNQVTDSLAPYLNSLFAPTARGRRITEMLSDTLLMDADYFAQMQGDVKDGEWYWLRAHVLETAPENMVTYFENWQGQVVESSIAATIYHVYRHNLVDSIAKTLLGDFDFNPQSEEILYRVANHLAFPLKGRDTINLKVLSRAVWQKTLNQLEVQLGTDIEQWQYKNYHQISLQHVAKIEAFSYPAFGAQGGPRTVNVSSGIPGTQGPSMRTLIEMNPNGIEAKMVLAGGQSGNPGHPNYYNQIESWYTVNYFPITLVLNANEQSWQQIIDFNHD
jgi:penicillin amidase